MSPKFCLVQKVTMYPEGTVSYVILVHCIIDFFVSNEKFAIFSRIARNAYSMVNG